jgi:hypothetical protein
MRGMRQRDGVTAGFHNCEVKPFKKKFYFKFLLLVSILALSGGVGV